jgi:hypothetical protein
MRFDFFDLPSLRHLDAPLTMIASGGVAKNRSSKSSKHHPLRNSHAAGTKPSGHLEKALKDWMAEENATMEEFRHEPLPSPRSIRLLRLLPAHEDDAPVRAELFTANLDAPPPYEAISYVWGAAAPRHITCASTSSAGLLAVPESLFHALRALRSDSSPRVVWADAACINQPDLVERAAQVDAMGDVFERADRVVVWLGADDEGTAREAMQLVADVNAHFEAAVAGTGAPAARVEERVAKVPPLPDGHPLHSPSFPSTTSAPTPTSPAAARWAAVVALLSRPWFFRVWALQEAGRARRCEARCGRDAAAPLSALVQFAALLNRRGADWFPAGVAARVGALCDAFHSTWVVSAGEGGEGRQTWLSERPILDEMLRTSWQRIRPSVVQALQYARAFHCSDARDHVYALLGHPLMQVGGRRLVDADYTRDVHSLNRLVTERIIAATRSLEAIGCVEHADEDGGNPGPTWVPAWHAASGAEKLAFPGDASLAAETRAECFRADFFTAGGGAAALRASGIVFDAVAATTRAYRWRDYDAYSSPLPTRQQLNVVEECWRLCDAPGAGAAEMVPNKLAYANKMFVLLWTLLGGTYGSSGAGGDDVETAQADFRRYVEVKCTPAFSYRVGKVLPPAAAADRRREGGGPASNGGAGSGGYHAGDWKRFRIEAGKKGHLRRFFVTRKGGYGLGPATVRAGDVLAVLFGAGMPVVLRPVVGGEERYTLVGECFVHGAMGGSVIHSWRKGKFRRQDIVLV